MSVLGKLRQSISYKCLGEICDLKLGEYVADSKEPDAIRIQVQEDALDYSRVRKGMAENNVSDDTVWKSGKLILSKTISLLSEMEEEIEAKLPKEEAYDEAKREKVEESKRLEYLKSLEERILSSPSASSVFIASGPSVVRNAIERSGFPEEARREHSTLANDLLGICFNHGINPGPDEFVACLSFYIFADVSLRESVHYLLAYVSQNERELPADWAPHFATHALKVLTGQEDIDDEYMCYETSDRHDTIKRVLNYISELRPATIM